MTDKSLECFNCGLREETHPIPECKNFIPNNSHYQKEEKVMQQPTKERCFHKRFLLDICGEPHFSSVDSVSCPWCCAKPAEDIKKKSLAEELKDTYYAEHAGSEADWNRVAAKAREVLLDGKEEAIWKIIRTHPSPSIYTAKEILDSIKKESS